MKEVMINGVTYLPASALAKEFRYTADYIGQLCRAKKVDAQLIGRSWYVNPLSLTAHKKAKFTKPVAKPEVAEEVHDVQLSRITVPPFVTRAARTHGHSEQNFANRIDWKPLKYEVDEGELLPLIARVQAPTKIAVDLAESTVVAIKTSTKSTHLVPDELPTVSLKGSLKVTSLNEEYRLESEMEELSETEVPLSANETKIVNLKSPQQQSETQPRVNVVTPASAERALRAYRLAKPSLVVPPPVLVIDEEEVSVASSYHTLELSLTVFCVVLVGCLALLVFGESSVEATEDSYHLGIDFSTTSLSALVSYFSY